MLMTKPQEDKKLTQAERNALRERLKVELRKEFGSTAERFAIGFGFSDAGKTALAIRVQVNNRQWQSRKIRGQDFETFRARFPKTFEGVELQVAFLGPVTAG